MNLHDDSFYPNPNDDSPNGGAYALAFALILLACVIAITLLLCVLKLLLPATFTWLPSGWAALGIAWGSVTLTVLIAGVVTYIRSKQS